MWIAKPIVKRVSLREEILLWSLFKQQPESDFAWITIIPENTDDISWYEYVTSWKAFEKSENQWEIHDTDELKAYLSSLKNRAW